MLGRARGQRGQRYDWPVRVAVISPYSLNYAGGVGQHAEALVRALRARGHDALLLAPVDPDDRWARFLHRGARPLARELPEWVVPLGRTVALPANGALSNLCLTANGVARLSWWLRHGEFDVVHVHEPNAPAVSWFAVEHARAPLVATFHAYSTSRPANWFAANVAGCRRLYRKITRRIAVSEAAAWTARRFYGGRYELIPNGVDLAAGRAARASVTAERAAGGSSGGRGHLEVLFLGRADERKGLPVLLRAFEALRRAGVAARLVVAGPDREEVEVLSIDDDGIVALGRVDERTKWRLLASADLLAAPALGGESFGMVLTEAFAAGTPVVASDIPGYRDVVTGGARAEGAGAPPGILVPPGDALALAATLRELAHDRQRLAALASAAERAAERYDWQRVAQEVESVYEQAIAAPRTSGLRARVGLAAAETPPPPRPCAVPEPAPTTPLDGQRTRRALRRAATALGAVVGSALAWLAVERLGLDSIAAALIKAAPLWVAAAVALMAASLLLRAEAWHAILRSALAAVRVRRRDAARATMIGVLMSATLPARLGEPSRALVVARRLGRVRDRLPIVLGTLISQTVLNLAALAALAVVTLSSLDGLRTRPAALVGVVAVPLALVVLIAAFPWLVPRDVAANGGRIAALAALARELVGRVRSGLRVFRRPRFALWASICQTGAWALQLAACYVLLSSLGIHVEEPFAAAAAVLFAVNITAVLPATPSNIGVFQAACVAVLSAYGVGRADALAYGIILQAVEIGTAFALGLPALVREGLTWRELRVRALHAAPIELPPAPIAVRERPARAES